MFILGHQKYKIYKVKNTIYAECCL
jgi:hypothetical protein